MNIFTRKFEIKNTSEQKQMDFDMEVKDIAEDGTFVGYGAIFGNVDRGGDIIQKGAFDRSLKEISAKNRKIPMLWQHDSHNPIGFFENVKEDNQGLLLKGHIDLDVQAGKEAYSRLKKKYISGLSIGYSSLKSFYNEKEDTRTLVDVDLFEVSLVTFPMNDEARIQTVKQKLGEGVKPKTIQEFEKFLRDAGFSRKDATSIASHGIKPLLQSDSESEELKQGLEILQNFKLPTFNSN